MVDGGYENCSAMNQLRYRELRLVVEQFFICQFSIMRALFPSVAVVDVGVPLLLEVVFRELLSR